MQVPKIRGCALSWWLVAALMVCQLKLSEASDCSATAVAKDGSRDARSVCSSSQFDSILTPFDCEETCSRSQRFNGQWPLLDTLPREHNCI